MDRQEELRQWFFLAERNKEFVVNIIRNYSPSAHELATLGS